MQKTNSIIIIAKLPLIFKHTLHLLTILILEFPFRENPFSEGAGKQVSKSFSPVQIVEKYLEKCLKMLVESRRLNCKPWTP